MKHTSSTLAFAVIAALGAGNANALTRTEYATALKVYFGGATATDNVLESVFTSADGDGICDPFFGQASVGVWRAANQRVVTCRVSNENPITAGKGFATRAAGGTAIAFHKESTGGSSNGVNPLIAVAKGQAHALRWLNVGGLANDCTVTNVAATTNTIAYIDHSGCALVETTADTAGSAGAAGTFDINGGISDNEPALAFPAPGADAGLLTSVPGIQILFGVPVTTALYRALQQVQFIGSPACLSDTDPSDTIDSRDSTACVPSLEKQQVSALVSQQISNWNDFKAPNGTQLTTAAGVTPPADEFVRICRRVSTSGTQATFEALLLNQRCASGTSVFAVPDDSSTETDTVYSANQFAAGSLVNAAPSSGNVRTCLASANTGNFWGLGVLSTEVTASNYGAGNATTPPGGNGFRFVAINGAAPNLVNAANGTYDLFSENTVNRIKADGIGSITGQRLEIVNLVSTRLGNVDALNTINATFAINAPWGQGGVLALPATTNPSTAPYSVAELAANPIGTQSRNGNTCNMPAMVKPQPADNR
jgi:ABC-type phosphate transport system substrate-binding protein